MYFTTSWDDGHFLDQRLSKLLSKYGIKGTFYLSKNYLADQLEKKEIVTISKFHEIGAHTLSHPKLSTLEFNLQFDEIYKSKMWLEEILDMPCEGFCYPSGDYNMDSIKAVEQSGFLYARTVKPHVFDIDKTCIFEVPTTLQVYPYPFRKKNKSSYLWEDLFCPLRNNMPLSEYIGIRGLATMSWCNMAISLFKYAIDNDKRVFHLWGHSWEIEKYGLWGELEKFLKYVSVFEQIKFLSNKDVVKEMTL